MRSNYPDVGKCTENTEFHLELPSLSYSPERDVRQETGDGCDPGRDDDDRHTEVNIIEF